MELLRPALAWTLLGALLALAAGLWAHARARRELAAWVAERQAARFVPGHSRARAAARVVLASAGLALLALALLGPVVGHTLRPVSRRGLDLVVCLDTSRSMLAQDLRPSRLERAKREIVGLLERMAGDRVALVAFSGEARDVSPLTRDRATLENLLAFVSSEDNQKGGTDLAAAIARGLDLLDGRSGAHEAIVLITDGEDLEGQGLELAEQARERGIRLFVLGVGTVEGGKIPVIAADGKQSFLTDEEGREVVTKLDRAALVELARRTGGEFLAADESATPLEDLYRARITRIEGREITSGERRVPYDRFQWPLAAGIGCLLAARLLGLRFRRSAARAEPARLAAAFLAVPLAFGDGSEAPAQRLGRAADEFARGELAKAELTATALLDELAAAGFAEADRARAHLALGVIRAARAADEEDEAQSRAAFEGAHASLSAARALAGAGALRLDATYDLGTLELLRGERWRAELPEISGQAPGMPGLPPGAPGAGPDDGPPPPDPLAEARKHYLEARTWLGERLRAEARDADTRANLELVQRRLRELDKIEQEREKQEQEQENQDQQQDENQDEQEQQDQDEKDQDKKDQEQKDQEQKNQDGEPQEGDPKEQEEPEEQPSEEEQKQEQEPSEQKTPENSEEEAKEEQAPRSGEGEERVLTREEVMQLLDRLAELEKQQKALEAQLRAKRAKAKRDW